MHLLKWRYQPWRRTESWSRTLREQRRQIAALLNRSPSLHVTGPASLDPVYPRARQRAARETGLSESIFPQTCPWTVDQVLDETFWPEGEA